MIQLLHDNGQGGRDRFGAYDGGIQALRSTVPAIHQALRPDRPLEDLDGWQAMLQRHDAFREQGGAPVLVATLYGPTGAGKSTLFRHLTGIPVPAGDDVRPVSYACALAVPPSLAQPGCLERVFPGFPLQRLSDAKQLKLRSEEATPTYWAPSSAAGGKGRLPVALADVPDFNSLEQSNWAKAEHMMRRAEIVLFVVYRESYADERVVRELARCCRLAARMVYVLTKTDRPEQAKRIWEDLIGKLVQGDGPHGQAFREQRADGQTLLAFLSGCPVYYSPRAEPPDPPSVYPLSPEAPPLDSLLCGLDAENILLDGLLQPARRVVQACRQMAGEAAARSAELQGHLEQVQADVGKTAELIASTEFPVGRWMQLVAEEARRHQSRLLRMLAAPGYWLRSGLRQAVQGGKRLIELLCGRGGDEIRQRHELEGDRLREATDRLFDRWRSRHPGEACEGGILSQYRCEKVRDSFHKEDVPEPAVDWEEHVRQEVGLWADEHPWLCSQMSLLSDALALAGVGLVVADLAATGGTFGALFASKMATVLIGGKAFGVLAAAGAGSTAAGLLLEWAGKWKLSGVLHKADDHWRRQRAGELVRHLAEHLCHPLFGPWQEQLARLEKAPLGDCLRACAVLDELGQARSRGPFRFRCGGLAHTLEELLGLCQRHPEDAAWHLSEGHFEPFLRDAGLLPLADHVGQIRACGSAQGSPLDCFLEVAQAAAPLAKEPGQ